MQARTLARPVVRIHGLLAGVFTIAAVVDLADGEPYKATTSVALAAAFLVLATGVAERSAPARWLAYTLVAVALLALALRLWRWRALGYPG